MFNLWNRFQYLLSPQLDIYEQVSKVVRGKVADIGCGPGFGTMMLAQKADEVRGYDVDKQAVQFAQRVFGNHHVIFKEGDITRSTVRNYFDFVVMVDVIEHIEDTKTVLDNCRQMLKNNGVFICSTPNRLSRYRKASDHVCEYSPGEFKKMLKQSFVTVHLRDYKLEEARSRYNNPMLAVCSVRLKGIKSKGGSKDGRP